MPLTMANSGREFTVISINGTTNMRMKLNNIGIMPGIVVRIISKNPSSLLIGFRDTRIMIQSGLAHQILVQ